MMPTSSTPASTPGTQTDPSLPTLGALALAHSAACLSHAPRPLCLAHIDETSAVSASLTHFGAVLSTPALVPWKSPLTPCSRQMARTEALTVRCGQRGSCSATVALKSGVLTHCTLLAITRAGSALAATPPMWNRSCSSRLPASDPPKIAARAHVIPN